MITEDKLIGRASYNHIKRDLVLWELIHLWKSSFFYKEITFEVLKEKPKLFQIWVFALVRCRWSSRSTGRALISLCARWPWPTCSAPRALSLWAWTPDTLTFTSLHPTSRVWIWTPTPSPSMWPQLTPDSSFSKPSVISSYHCWGFQGFLQLHDSSSSPWYLPVV